MVDESTVRVRQLARSRAEEMRFSRWLANDKVTVEEMMDNCGRRIAPLAAGRHILAIHDTSEINYQKHAGRTKGLGTVGNGTDAGLFLHPILAVDAENGACLGLVGAIVWLRTKGKAADRATLPVEQKESFRWLKSAETARRCLRDAAHVTMIADRESDIYEEWARLPDDHFDLLTRVHHDRAIVGGGTLYSYTDSLPVVFSYKLDLPAVSGKRVARVAKMELRFGSVTIKRPQRSDPKGPTSLTLRIVDVREIADPGCLDEPVHWRLMTTHDIDGIEDAIQLVDWYCQRWNIEQLFRTVKRQGLDVEASEVERGDSLLRLAALAIQAATRCMQLVLARDGHTDQSAAVTFDPEEIPILAAIQTTLEGKTEKQRNPYPKASLAWAAWIIARLGGWKGYRSERPPGPITMHNGLVKFDAMARGWKLAQQMKVGHEP